MILTHPSRVLVVSFLAICSVGTLLLGLPTASTTPTPIGWLDAAFTAVSATCVTGLIVVDTPVVFSTFGQVVLLLLIQIGGLGIMVFSAAALVLFGRRLSLSHERAAVEIVGAEGRAGLLQAVKTVFLVTFVTETVAALLLFIGFALQGDPLAHAAWKGVFTSISAFCNAGFALQSDSLVPYATNPFILSVTALTIILGGLGPPVVAAALTWRGSIHKSLYVRIVLWTTGILILIPALFWLVAEWHGTLAHLSPLDKVINATFQSITLRTAGFNSLDLAKVQPATWTVMILVMFVGGSPGSTAGGVKTTTIAVVTLAMLAVIQGRERVEILGRTLNTPTVLRALVIVFLSSIACGAALIALQLTQELPLDVVFFEVVSALATVGLSTGGTGALDEVGKILIIACMFAGRVGPLTLFVFLSANTPTNTSRRFPEEHIPVG